MVQRVGKRGRWWLAPAVIAGCTHSTLDLDRPGSAARHKTVTVADTLVAGSSALASFPLLVRTFDDPELRSQLDGGGVAFADGSDLRFEIAGTELAREIERYDPVTGTLVAWVLVPSLSPGGPAIDLLYGGAPSTVDPTDVWQDYAAVWHLGEDPALGAASDSSAGATHGTAVGFSAGATVPGIAGAAIDFAGAQRISFGDAPALDVGLEPFSYSVWVRSAPTTGAFDMPFFNGGSSTGTIGFDMELGENNWSGCVSDGVNSTCGTVGDEVDLAGEWHHLVFVVDRTGGVLLGYVDGVAVSTDPLGAIGSLSSTLDLSIGANNVGSFPFHGLVDEVRVARFAAGSAWIATESANVGSSGLISVGAQDSP